MGSSIPKSAAEILQRMFDVVLEEARTHPEFAEKLLRSLPFDAVARIEVKEVKVEAPPKKAPAKKVPAAVLESAERPTPPKKPQPAVFDPNAFSLIAELKILGDAGLREKLKGFTPRELQNMVEEQNLALDDKVFRNKKKTSRDIVEAIIAALRARIAGRIVASS
jgi:hypothetical protein